MKRLFSALVRHLTILRILDARRQGATIKEIAHETGVSEKTVRRDLEAFAAAGQMIAEQLQERGRNSRIIFAPDGL